MYGFTKDLLLAIKTTPNSGLEQLNLVLQALPPTAAKPEVEIAEVIRQIIAILAEKISILSEPTRSPLSQDNLETYTRANDALATMAQHPALFRYFDHIIDISAEYMAEGKGSMYIARVLNSIARFNVTDIHLSMLDHQILPLTLSAFKNQAQAYYALPNTNTDAPKLLLQYGMLLFKLCKFTSAPSEKFKITIRDKITAMLEEDLTPPGHLPLHAFLGNIDTTSSYAIKRSAIVTTGDSPSNSSSTIPQTALTLFSPTPAASSIEKSGSSNTMVSFPDL